MDAWYVGNVVPTTWCDACGVSHRIQQRCILEEHQESSGDAAEPLVTALAILAQENARLAALIGTTPLSPEAKASQSTKPPAPEKAPPIDAIRAEMFQRTADRAVHATRMHRSLAPEARRILAITDDTERSHAVHAYLAQQQKSRTPPAPQTWDALAASVWTTRHSLTISPEDNVYASSKY